jgi:hypothetical protein
MTSESLSAERIFDLHFAKLYPPDVLAHLARVRATDANPAANPSIRAQIDETAARFARLAPAALDASELVLDFSDASVHRLGARLTREVRDRWFERTATADEPPVGVQVVIHGALYVGACIVHNHAGEWLARRPLWESLVRLRSRAGTADLAPFHWWLKSLSDDEIGKCRLGDRYRTHVEVPTFDSEALAVLAPPDRRIPRLAKVRYDTLYKHLRAHLPELRSVGDDFPSPERLHEMAFRWLDFQWLGSGRMLLMHGPTDRGVHLFWLDVNGFVKSAYYPADSFPAHIVETEGDLVRVMVSIQGRPHVHEMLWWGA